MSIASRITEIETHIGDVYDTINYSYDTTGVNKNIINIPKYLKKGYIDIINNGIDTLYNNFPKVSGIGSNLSLTPTYEAPMKLNEIQGDTLQDGTPTPNTPVPIQSVTGLQNVEVCGKNLLDASQSVNGYINSSGGIGESNYDLLSDYIKVESGKNYTISLNTQFYNIGYAFYDSSKTYILRYNTNRNVTTLTTTIPSGTSYIRIWFNYNGTTTLTPANILQYEPMIEQGSATEYEPYKGNTYEVNLGKNLLDYNTTFATPTNSTVDSDGWITASYDNTSGSSNAYANYYTKIPDGVKIKPNTTYYVYLEVKNVSYSGTSTGNYINVTNVNASYISQTGISLVRLTDLSNNSIYKYEITTKSDLSGISGLLRTFVGIQAGYSVSLTYRLTLSESNIDVSDFTYSPYFTPIELNKIGDYKDRIYKDSGKWYVEKQIGKVVLNGSENWSENGENTDYGQYSLSISNKQYGNDLLSDKFIPHTGSTGNYIWGRSTNNNIYITIAKSIISYGLATFKTWLSNNNTIVYYILSTPTTTEITNTELIEDLETLYTAKSQEGTTNISITSEDLEMILNVSALKGEV